MAKKSNPSKKVVSKKAPLKKSTGSVKSPYGTKKFVSIDEYHASFSTEVQTLLDQIRKIIRKAAPQSVEEISYNMPAFRQGKVLVYYAANKEHLGFYPTPGPLALFSAELSKYKSSKGAVQFPYHQKLPVALIEKMVKFRVKEEAERSAR